MKYYIIAGERSGDLHASNLYKSILKEDTSAISRGIGGNYLEKAGMEIFKHFREISFMGFAEVLMNIFKIREYFNNTKNDILKFNPDVIVLVDFAGFNLRIAKFAKKNNIKVYYYISPKIWAWNTSRALKIKSYVDKMFVILPFEKQFYKKFQFDVDYVGNPVLDAIAQFNKSDSFLARHRIEDKPIIAILPGSRKQEIESMLHFMLSIIPSFKDYHFVIAGVSNLESHYYQQFTRGGQIKVVIDETYDLLSHASAALVTSGTATLETALFNVPQLVGYKLNIFSFWIGKMVVKVPYISLVNLIVGREVVKELLQDDFHPNIIRDELAALLNDAQYRDKQLKGYAEMKTILGSPGASDKAAKLMVNYLKDSNKSS
ncbi:lipid-A-disaccharide synthase [Hyphobacterium sp. CCMP332]|nr:lipid-A-disaccharide synthase [Hyphobacterium sp. CCMP332]